MEANLTKVEGELNTPVGQRPRIRAVWQFGVRSQHTVEILSQTPRDNAGLQAVDYLLWALQRLYEKGEKRYWEFVRRKARLIYDLDDTRLADYGVYYTPSNPLTLAARAKK